MALVLTVGYWLTLLLLAVYIVMMICVVGCSWSTMECWISNGIHDYRGSNIDDNR